MRSGFVAFSPDSHPDRRDGFAPRGYGVDVNTIFGLPAHPLFVHVPVVLIPLAFVGALVMLALPSWWSRLMWPTSVVACLGALGALLAGGSGEGLEEARRAGAVRELVREHTQSGEVARTTSLIFVGILLVAVFGPRFVARITSRSWWRPVVAVAIVVSGATASWAMYDAGHSGATSVWHDVSVGNGD